METDSFLTQLGALSVLKKNFSFSYRYLNYQLCSPNPCQTSASRTSVFSCCHTQKCSKLDSQPPKGQKQCWLGSSEPSRVEQGKRYNSFSQILGGNLESGACWVKFAPVLYLSAHIHCINMPLGNFIGCKL